MTKKPYLKRILDNTLCETLTAFGAVLIKGPKGSGKTRTAREHAKSELLMQDPDNRSHYSKMADTKPSLLLNGNTPRLIDEWQIAPVLWDAVRFAVDERQIPGQFILTGSAVPQDDEILHTGTGRITPLLLRTMSLYESLESNGSVSLKTLFDNFESTHSFEGAHSDLTIEELAFALVRGGWPVSVLEPEQPSLKRAKDYTEAIINTDVSRVDNTKRNPARVRALMRSLARNTATTANMSAIRLDMASDEDEISEKTISDYINALRRLFVIEDLPAWNPAMRSKTALRTSPKRHFIDPSIAAAVLRISPGSLLEDFNTFGFLFESLCVRDLRVYAQALDGEVFHFRDKYGLEADAIIHLHDGRWCAIEVKMGKTEIEEAALHLLELSSKVDIQKMRRPSFLMVLTATEYAYRRDDGVLVVPIGCLCD
jgi:predicted AAA+ superfamily ATPase